MSTEGPVFESSPAWERMPAFTTVRRGYDPAQVLTFVKQARERIEALEAKIRDLEREREELARDRDVALRSWEAGAKEPYDAMAERLAGLMRSIDAEVEKLRTDAQTESERTLSEAREEADRIVGKARTDADQIESDLFAMYGSTINELRGIREHMQKAVHEIDVVLDAAPADQVVVLEQHGEEREEGQPARPDEPSASAGRSFDRDAERPSP